MFGKGLSVPNRSFSSGKNSGQSLSVSPRPNMLPFQSPSVCGGWQNIVGYGVETKKKPQKASELILGPNFTSKRNTALLYFDNFGMHYSNEFENRAKRDGMKVIYNNNPYQNIKSVSHIQSKLGELRTRTLKGKKYNYCGPGTKLEERLASNDPKYRDPINNLDSMCKQPDSDYRMQHHLPTNTKQMILCLREYQKYHIYNDLGELQLFKL